MTDLVNVQIEQPDNSAEQKAQQALSHAESIEITDPVSYEAATYELKALKAKYREIEEQRKSLKKPIDEAARRIQGFFKPPLDFLSQAEGVIKRKITTWNQEQERLRREEQRKVDEAARKERERLEARARKAEEKGQADKAEQLSQQAETVTPALVPSETPKAQGISTRKVWKFRVVDASKVPDKYKVIDEKKIAGVVRSLGADAEIPGVEVYPEEVIAARSARV